MKKHHNGLSFLKKLFICTAFTILLTAKASPACAEDALTVIAPRGTMIPAFSESIQNYTVYVSADVTAASLIVYCPPGSSYEVTGPSSLTAEEVNAYTMTVTTGESNKMYNFNFFRFSSPNRLADEEYARSLIESLRMPDTESISIYSPVIDIPAYLLEDLWLITQRAEYGELIFINNTGTAVIRSNDVTDSSSADSFNITLSAGSTHDLSGIIPDNSQMYSTVLEGPLFGNVEFHLPCTFASPVYIYVYDSNLHSFRSLSRGKNPENGVVSFYSNLGGTFILTTEPIQEASPTIMEERNTSPPDTRLILEDILQYATFGGAGLLVLSAGFFSGRTKGKKLKTGADTVRKP